MMRIELALAMMCNVTEQEEESLFRVGSEGSIGEKPGSAIAAPSNALRKKEKKKHA